MLAWSRIENGVARGHFTCGALWVIFEGGRGHEMVKKKNYFKSFTTEMTTYETEILVAQLDKSTCILSTTPILYGVTCINVTYEIDI